jgi:5-aminolevulinate synthase
MAKQPPSPAPSSIAEAIGALSGQNATASRTICDAIRSYAPGFIFTTSIAPAIAAGALASIRHLKKSSVERERHQERARALKTRFTVADIPVMSGPSHIVPVLVAEPVRCKALTNVLLDRYGIYVQPINYPTVPRGTERLRLTPSPQHSDADMEHLVSSLSELWVQCPMALMESLAAAE